MTDTNLSNQDEDEFDGGRAGSALPLGGPTPPTQRFIANIMVPIYWLWFQLMANFRIILIVVLGVLSVYYTTKFI